MSDEAVSTPAEAAPLQSKPLPEKPGSAPPRQWLIVPVVLVSLYWIAYVSLQFVEMAAFFRFLWQLVPFGLMVLLFMVWWLAIYRGMRFLQRLAVTVVFIAMGVASTFALHPDVLPPVPIMMTLPWMFTLGTLWVLLAMAASANVRMYGLLALGILGWVPMTLVRMDGMSGGGVSALHWRWSQSEEEKYLAELAAREKQSAATTPVKLDLPLEVSQQDWPGFRGPNRDSNLTGVKIETDWEKSPPKEIWRKRIGPGWSSFTVVSGVLYTQDQRGDAEAVAAYDADTGNEIWVHTDTTRFDEQMGGPGPRATPTYVEGRLYTLGANGELNCLDAANGELIWTRNIAEDAVGPDGKPHVPMWAYSNSPLVHNGLVYVCAASPGSDKDLLAYRAESGEPAWTAKAGTHSYSSPQLATIDGVEQIVFVSDTHAIGFDPATGAELWKHEGPEPGGGYSSIQPNFVTPSRLAYSFNMQAGIELLEVSRDENDQWQTKLVWDSNAMNPFFNDLVVYDGALYGFDNDIFCCIDAETGKRNWKGGRYDTGQVLLLADQPLLLVTSEWGEVILVAVDPEKHRELGRFKAFEGKTWNHPVLVGNRLYLRNAEEMACYELQTLAP